jgi:hypothetical protein
MDGDEQLNNCQHRDRLTTPVQLGPDRADHEPTVVEADYPPMIQVAAYSDRELEQAHQVGVEHFSTTPQKFAQPSLDRIARATVCATLRLAVWVPQAVVVLLEVLLEKDPGRRFQNPTDLLKAMPTITGAMGARRKITRRSLLETPATALSAIRSSACCASASPTNPSELPYKKPFHHSADKTGRGARTSGSPQLLLWIALPHHGDIMLATNYLFCRCYSMLFGHQTVLS